MKTLILVDFYQINTNLSVLLTVNQNQFVISGYFSGTLPKLGR
jgi:hypothetical protein